MIILISWLINLEYAKDDEGCEVETENLAAGGRSRQNLKSGIVLNQTECQIGGE